ncbi:MAG: LCP family protein [Spirochaetaceae bacterium]
MIEKRLWIFLTVQSLLLVLLLLLNGALLIRQQRRGEESRERLVEEIRSNAEAVDSVRSGLLRLAEDSGEVRDSLMLPPRNYSFLEDERESGNGEAQEEASPFVPYFTALQELVEYNRRNASYAAVGEFLDIEEVLGFLREERLWAESAEEGRYRISRQEETVAHLELEEEPNTFTLTLPDRQRRTIRGAEEFVTALREELERRRSLERRRAEAERTLRGLEGDASVRELLGSEELYFGPLSVSGDRLQLPVLKGRNSRIFTVEWSAAGEVYTVGSQDGVEAEALPEALRLELSKADLRTEGERLLDSRVEELQELFEDSGFQGYLETLGLSVSRKPREGEEYLYFDIEERGGRRAGSFAIQRLNGAIWIMDEDDVPLTSLRRIKHGEPREEKSSSREFDGEVPEVSGLLSRQGEETFLVIGSHEQMADTIILAHVNHRESSIQLISVPRDLYYRGRKINGLYPQYGGERFCSEMADITGLEIAGYVAIDMYAFIDAVNILGGLEVTLREPLVDPTYRTKEKGRWSTLFYPAGTHRLSGIEALRLARSRHGDSDFGRAERQQSILRSMKRRISQLGTGDAGTLYELASSLFRYVESDLSYYAVARLLTQVRTYEITNQVVLNTDNILYHTYSNLYYSGKSADEVDEEFHKGAWILLPKEDDWNVIRWYIREFLDGEAA